MDLASQISGQVDGGALARLQPGDESTPEFCAVRDTLHLIKQSNPEILYLYTMRQNGSRVEFVVDESYGFEEDTPLIGEVYPDTNPDLMNGFREVSADHEFTTDQWGTVLSGYAPIFDDQGNPVGLVGVDRDSATVISEIDVINRLGFTRYMIVVIGISLLAIWFDVSRTRSADQIERANKKLNLLNSIIRHDMLNTLTGLLGIEDMALESTNDAAVRSQLTEIKDLTKKIERQINFTRDYQNLGTAEPEWQNLREILQRALSMLDLAGVHLSMDCFEVEIYADQLFERVLYNLVDNALRYGGHVHTITIRCTASERGLDLIVEDDGVGIPDTLKDAIFAREHFHHTGFGLLLSREILSITKITIAETGVFGKGARFELSIPPGCFRRLPLK